VNIYQEKYHHFGGYNMMDLIEYSSKENIYQKNVFLIKWNGRNRIHHSKIKIKTIMTWIL
jgi:hypothetical protein